MAVGDSNNVLGSLKFLLPPGWFASTAPIRDAVLGGVADAFAKLYALYEAVKAQTRRATASGWFLDLIGWDFFGPRIVRKSGQNDASWSVRIKQEVTRPRVTRAGIIGAVEDLTSQPATIFEPANAADTGGFGAAWAMNESSARFGSLAYPNTIFVTAVQPQGTGIPNLAGLDDPQGGFGAGEFAFADERLITGPVTDADIYAAVNDSRAAGVTAWVNIGPAPVPITDSRLDIDFTLDSSVLA